MIQIDPQRIKEARGNVSQTDLAYKIAAIIGENCTASMISAWERSVSNPSQRMMAALCEATGRTPNFFFGLNDSALLTKDCDKRAS